jgi:hypothetical protein
MLQGSMTFGTNQIKDAVDVELARKGLTKTDAENADLQLGYQLGIGTETQINSYKTGWGLSFRFEGILG